MKRVLIAALLVASAHAQTCTDINSSACGTTGVYAGPPTLRAFVSGQAAAYGAIIGANAGLAQPRIILSAEIVPASESFMVYDPTTCPTSGTCLYNNATVIDNYIDSLVSPPPTGLGLTSVDINLWVSPFFTASQYLAGGLNYCGTYGTCYTPTTSNQAWFSRGLGTYDTVFAHLASAWPNVKVRVAPMISGDVVNVCSAGFTTWAQNNYTGAQVQACLTPLWAAIAKRYAGISDFTVWHENCGVVLMVIGTETGNTNGCAETVADEDAMITAMAVAVRAVRSSKPPRIGVGGIESDMAGTCPSSGWPSSITNSNTWCDMYKNLMPAGTVDFGGEDIYPTASALPANYGNTLATFAKATALVQAIGKQVVANESSANRWQPTSGSGEATTYWGCDSMEWYTDGTALAWARATAATWASAQGLQIFSIFPNAWLMYLSTDTANNHCITSDGSLAILSGKLGTGTLVSPAGKQYGNIAAGWNASLQGNARVSGRASIR